LPTTAARTEGGIAVADITLITGTSTGIGFETALHMARSGYRVYATMRNPDAGAAALRDAAKAAGAQLEVAQLDVTDAASVDRCVRDILKAEGRIDVLVNNAGIHELRVVEQTTDAFTQEIFETNVFGPLRLMRAVLPGMRERRSGTIVNVSSVAGRIGAFAQTLYCGTKHALEAISEGLAIEVREFGIRVAIIEPGIFNTPIVQKAFAGADDDQSSPYAAIDRRIAGIYAAGAAADAHPRAVAEAIERAVSSEDPKLRYPVGVDATVFLDGRARLSDEEWVEFGAPMTDEAFWALFARTFPMPAG
jgi:NAD(P)-dependent dehydrogenase (short-subunit alcohol dehydrogenase family)